jgi:hypothetical protein
VIARWMHSAGARSWHLHAMSLGSIVLCLSLWIRAKTLDQDVRENAERRAIFVGLWPPTLWMIGNAVQQVE